jgi:hypothetical protein
VGEEEAKCTGQRVRVVSTSFTNSVSLPRSHCRRWGPDRAERKVRGEPEGSRLRTGAPEEKTEVVGEEGNEIVGWSGGNQGRKGRTEIGGTVTCWSGGDT